MTEIDNIIREALIMTTVISAPVVLACVVLGLIIAVIQTATQLQEQAMSFAIKLFATTIVVLVSAKWGSSYLIKFSMRIIESIPSISSSLG